MNPAGGEGTPARDVSHATSRAGHIECCICTDPIYLEQYRTARCWTDPDGTTCAAHAQCLIALGETDLHLPPAA